MYLILLTLYIILLYLRSLFWNGYHHFGRNFFWKCFLILLTMNILLQIWEEIHCEICTNILEENSSEIITWNWYIWISNFLYLGVKFFCKLYLILLLLCILLLCLRRNLFWNVYQYLGRKFVWNCYHYVSYFYSIAEMYSEMCTDIWEENSSVNCTWYCYHYVSYFSFWEKIYSEMCTNIWEENSSESLTSYCYHWVSYFYIWEEIYSESTAYMLILHVFVHCIWEENSSETCFFSG